MKNIPSHRYGAKNTLYNVTIKLSQLFSHLFIYTYHVCFSLTWCSSTTSICLFVSPKKTGMKSETYGVMWHVAPESRNIIGRLQTSTKIPTITFAIIRHTWHWCIYIFVIVINNVVVFFLWCTITSFTKM